MTVGDAVDRRLDAVVKAYDVRGTVPEPLSVAVVTALAQAFAELVASDGAQAVVIGQDMRTHSPELVRGVVAGVTAAGLDAVRIGLSSTDQLYFASGQLGLPGVMVTASHNAADQNGLKLCRAAAQPVGRDSGLRAVHRRAHELLSEPREPAQPGAASGRVTSTDVLGAYASHLHGLVSLPPGARRLRVVVDAANAMAGHTAPAVLGALPLDVVQMYFELDGRFPHHPANPLDLSTLHDLQDRVRVERADLGLAFDGDADRCFVIDERGEVVDPSVVTGLIAVRMLELEPGSTILHNVICSRAVPEIVGEHGGRSVRTPVGHSLIKSEMARTGAIFGGEHSGHYYFRDFWCADSGMLAALHVLASVAADSRPVSQQLAPYSRYVASGELNFAVGDIAASVAAVRKVWSERGDVAFDELDGLTVGHRDWWFNLRASNTESLLRFNAEGVDERVMRAIRDDVLTVLHAVAPTTS